MSCDLGEVEPLQEVLAVGQVLTLLVDLAEEEVQDVLCVALLISLDVVRIYLIPGEKNYQVYNFTIKKLILFMFV